MLKFLLILFFYSSAVFAEKNTEIETVKIDSVTSNTDAESLQYYEMLKLETKLDDLRLEIDDLKQQIEKLDIIQSQLINKINILAPKEDEAFLKAHLEDNLGEFKYAYEMMQSGKLDMARRAFQLFIEKYPEDIKIGETYFWLGEVAYKDKDYNEASKNYLISYRDYQDNPRRNDALFKLSIVLSIIDKKTEACSGFDILINNVNGVSENIRQKAIKESNTLNCP
jgi:TolA-binding protein